MRAFLMREGDRVRVVTPYVPEFVADLKEEIPYYAKTWDRESKNWLVDGEYEETALEVATRYFETTVVVAEAEALRRERAARAASAPPPRPDAAHSTARCAEVVRSVYREEAELYLLPGAPLAVIQAAYRAVSKLVHPDLAGESSHARMVAVNRAYDLLVKRTEGKP
jgi:hypothetical protein